MPFFGGFIEGIRLPIVHSFALHKRTSQKDMKDTQMFISKEFE